MSIGIFPECSVTETGRAIVPIEMSGRPALDVKAPKFGKYLAALRTKDRSHERIAQLVRPLVAPAGLKVAPSLILKYEQGRVPNWPMLAALARVYRQDLSDMVIRLARSLEFVGSSDLIGHASTRSSTPISKGGVDDPATRERLQDLEGKVLYYEEVLAHARTQATALAATLSPEGGEGAPAQSGRG